jgi:hypothetical protein
VEVYLNKLLQVRQTDLLQGYFATGAFTALLALCFWLTLRLSANSRVTLKFMKYAAGVVVLSSPPLFWTYLIAHDRWPLAWTAKVWPAEAIVAISLCLLFLTGRLHTPKWLLVSLLALHYFFWFCMFEPGYLASYVGPITPSLGFISVFVWGLYVRRRVLVPSR